MLLHSGRATAAATTPGNLDRLADTRRKRHPCDAVDKPVAAANVFEFVNVLFSYTRVPQAYDRVKIIIV